MFEVKNFDNWIEDKVSGKFGSGASEKIWLVNPETNEIEDARYIDSRYKTIFLLYSYVYNKCFS